MATVSATPSFTNALQILHDATKADKEADKGADREEKLKKAYGLYMKAFEEFKKQLQPYYESAEAIKKKLNIKSTTEGPADSSLKLDDVGGLGDCKEVLKEATIWPKMYPQFFTGDRKPWRAVLLYGPPGSGKTLLARAIAGEASIYLSRISPSDIVSKWMGDSEQQVKNIFQMAREKPRSIVFIDEIDSLCGQRGENYENEASRRIKSELLVHMQDVCDRVENVLILAATNTPFALDQAIRRRFDKRIYVPLPDKKARKHIFKIRIGNTPKTISEEEFDDLADATEGFSGSDISHYVKDALYEGVRATLTTKFFKKSGGKWVPCEGNEEGRVSLKRIDQKGENSMIEVPPCTAKHFQDVRGNQKKTVTKDDLKKFVEFTETFGIKG